jgi:dihydrofolate reductase
MDASRPKVVFSRRLERADWSNTRIVRGDPISEIRRLREAEGNGDLSLFGSSGLAGTLLKGGAIDEVRLLLCPVILGGGRSLLEGIEGRLSLRLKGRKELGSGVVILSYAPA